MGRPNNERGLVPVPCRALERAPTPGGQRPLVLLCALRLTDWGS
jgi:hypothetical protein